MKKPTRLSRERDKEMEYVKKRVKGKGVKKFNILEVPKRERMGRGHIQGAQS